MVRIGDQVHTLTFAYLCVYATITDSDVPDIRHRNKHGQKTLIYGSTDVAMASKKSGNSRINRCRPAQGTTKKSQRTSHKTSGRH